MNRATKRRLNRAYSVLAEQEDLAVNYTKQMYRKLRKEHPIYVGINSIKAEMTNSKLPDSLLILLT